MELTQFMEEAKNDEYLNQFLRETAEEASRTISIDAPQNYAITGVEILFGVAAYALFRWFKDYFDHQRTLNEVEIAKKQENLIKSLVKDGFGQEQAFAVTLALLEGIAKRGKDDPVIQAALRLIGSGE